LTRVAVASGVFLAALAAFPAAVVTGAAFAAAVTGAAFAAAVTGAAFVAAVTGAALAAAVMGAALAAAVMGAAFATAVTAFSSTRETDQALVVLYRFGIVPLFLFSGTFFPVTQLPGWLQLVAAARRFVKA
jgi:lipooligosaccharide transport system permease protein